MKKYELSEESKINVCGRTLYRIKALSSFTAANGYKINEGDFAKLIFL